MGEICLRALSDVLSQAEWMWLIQNVHSFLYGGALCKGDTNDSSFLWDMIPLLRLFPVRMRLLHYFLAVWWQGWWARAPGRAAGQENTGCGNGDGQSWWMPCHFCAAPDDTCSILVPRHLLIGQDEVSRNYGAVYVHVCEQESERECDRLKDRKVGGRKYEPKKREEQWINKTERVAFQFLSRHLYVAQNKIAKNVTYIRSAFGSSNWNSSALLMLNSFNEFHNFGSNSKLSEPMTAWRAIRHKRKKEEKKLQAPKQM